MERIIREITPLTHDDFFVIFNHHHAKFDYPVHYHPEYELNLVMNTTGRRIIGDSFRDFEVCDLVLIGPNTTHAWFEHQPTTAAHVVTIQFHSEFFSEMALNRKLMLPIREMLEKSKRGILFSKELAESNKDRIIQLSEHKGFDSLLDFLSLLYDLAISRNQSVLASPSYSGQFDPSKSQRLGLINDYLNKNLANNIKLKEVADLINMSETAFSHYFKKRTQRSFSDYITDLRIGNAARLIIETDKSISEICYECGFNNNSYFNRVFKKQKGCTPGEFRNQLPIITKH